MIYTQSGKKINVMFTPFRDGLQSSFGGKVRLNDYLPAMKASVDAGIRHIEFGGGARYQAPYFYLGENPFETMQAMRDAVGPDVELQILTRSVSGVTLTTQSMPGLDLQAKLMHKYGTTYDRNFDYMNDVENLIKTGKPIIDSGMHHQVCIAIMGLPFKSEKVHTADFYIDIGKRLLESGMQIDSICLKDASGTTDPKTIYDTVVGLKKIMPPEMPLWQHTHDTASMAVACYMAGIAGGVDGVDVSIRPMASGTVQPDIRSLDHALKGTGYSLDVDVSKIHGIEDILNEGLKDYNFNPTTTTADARVLGFPMPGGAIGPNVHMMVKAGILSKYSDVLAEFPVVVEAGGAWTSVTPGSQQYWLQAFNNVMYGRWNKIESGYGRAVLGYFGKTPLSPDPKVVEAASKQLELPVFEGDPLEAAANNVKPAQDALKERDLEVNDVNTFLVLAAMVPGKKIEVNEGIRFLTGKGKIDIPLKKKEEAKPVAQPQIAPAAPVPATSPVKTKCVIEENGKSRTFMVTLEPMTKNGNNKPTVVKARKEEPVVDGKPVFSTFAGTVDVVDILVKAGDSVQEGQVVAQIEAMKAKHDIKSQVSGTVEAVFIQIGDEIDSTQPILTIA
ncbi:MAG: biotin attachment protein [Calditrichaeota bacterium]|nr:MAG: biotin attachment protein [Calditrichota bacterium]MBL1205156.1 biotin attachment protein [Calditrichota bacterium]NOG44986.1 biotin attachment protein [Calditrichota bacterium]